VDNMTNADLWARVVQARTKHDDLIPRRVWALRNDGHEAAIDLKAVPGIGAEIVLTVDGELRKTRLFRSHEQAEVVGAIADTRASFEARSGPEMSLRKWCGCAECPNAITHGFITFA
jgi:hypothetical protein